MMRWGGCASLACLLLGACTLMPKYQPPANPAPEHYQQFVASPDCAGTPAANAAVTPTDTPAACVWGPAHPSDQLPRSDWWRDFADPTLDKLEADVDSANPDLAAALDRYQQARALENEARSALFPTLSAQA
ncbi:MAG TPA: hypothetical protein VGV09_16250, partial [Steroidobacteraceae bacterium]|nr:hypothetical protein [Steroidobacteraceae bacterium]